MPQVLALHFLRVLGFLPGTGRAQARPRRGAQGGSVV